MPRLATGEQQQARQFLAFADANLGFYRTAVRDFPFPGWAPKELVIPTRAQWQSADAADAIVRLAAGRRIVLINEAHHDPHTRLLTLGLLPRLRALGFTHFAAEALDEKDTALTARGYTLSTGTSQYLREPLYGEIVREAIRLGFVIVPYEASGGSQQDRETGQAEHLYRRVLAQNPAARLFVHAGYAHVDKTPGQLPDDARPMAMELRRLSGIDPLSIDQTSFRGGDTARQSPAYRRVAAAFRPDRAIVLLRRGQQTPWSAQRGRHDITVVLPPSNGSGRPDWLRTLSSRRAWPIEASLCHARRPCVVEARLVGESAVATPVGRYTLLHSGERAALYLRPGKYHVRAWSAGGKTLGSRDVSIGL